jgi:hypothetical protein
MNWGEIAELCHAESRRIRRELPGMATFFPPRCDIAETFLALERENNDVVGIAVRQFAMHRTWPKMTGVERAMLCFRLDFAATLANLLFEQPAPWTDVEDQGDDEERLGWLMLFAWEHQGFSALHDNLGRFYSHERVG